MSEVNDIQRLTKYKDGRMEFDVDGNYCCFDDVEWIIKRLEQQKAELLQAIESALNKSTKGGWLYKIFENIIEKHNLKI